MDLVRGAAIGGAVGAGIALVLRRHGTDRPSLGIETSHLHRISTLADRVAQFRTLSEHNAETQRLYAQFVAAADQFATHALEFTRVSQFKCNRFITEMGTHARSMCTQAQSATAQHLIKDVWPEVEKQCTDMLHNLILDLR